MHSTLLQLTLPPWANSITMARYSGVRKTSCTGHAVARSHPDEGGGIQTGCLWTDCLKTGWTAAGSALHRNSKQQPAGPLLALRSMMKGCFRPPWCMTSRITYRRYSFTFRQAEGRTRTRLQHSKGMRAAHEAAPVLLTYIKQWWNVSREGKLCGGGKRGPTQSGLGCGQQPGASRFAGTLHYSSAPGMQGCQQRQAN